jgi:hypothetical protein
VLVTSKVAIIKLMTPLPLPTDDDAHLGLLESVDVLRTGEVAALIAILVHRDGLR